MNWVLLRNSLMVAGGTVVLATCMGWFVAARMISTGEKRRRVLVLLSIITLALPPFLVTNSWLDLLGEAGAWRKWLPVTVNTVPGTVWVLALLLWPISALTIFSAWSRLETAQLESDLAVRGWALMRHLLMPLAWSALVPAGVVTFVLALNNFAVPAILQSKVFPAEVWIAFNTSFDTSAALKLSWPLIVAPLLLLVWLSRRNVPWPRLEMRVPGKLIKQQL